MAVAELMGSGLLQERGVHGIAASAERLGHALHFLIWQGRHGRIAVWRVI